MVCSLSPPPSDHSMVTSNRVESESDRNTMSRREIFSRTSTHCRPHRVWSVMITSADNRLVTIVQAVPNCFLNTRLCLRNPRSKRTAVVVFYSVSCLLRCMPVALRRRRQSIEMSTTRALQVEVPRAAIPCLFRHREPFSPNVRPARRDIGWTGAHRNEILRPSTSAGRLPPAGC
jgi:hypothetical protein